MSFCFIKKKYHFEQIPFKKQVLNVIQKISCSENSQENVDG